MPEQNTKSQSSTKNDLVIYGSQPLDISQHIRELQTPISELNPETRIVSDDGMYAGGFENIEFGKYGIDGIAYVRFLQSLKEWNPEEASLLERISRKLFGEQKADDKFLVEYKGIKYRQQWSVSTSKYKTKLFDFDSLNREVRPIDFPVELKTKIANEMNEVVSNDLLLELFKPLFDPLIQVYQEIAKF